MNPFVDPDICLRWVTTIASIGVLISTLEFLAMKRQFQSRGLFDWDVLKTRRDITTGTGFVARVLDGLLIYPNILYVLGFRATAAGLLVIGPNLKWGFFAGITTIYFTNILLFGIRDLRGTGADDMVKVVFGALFFGQVVATGPLAAQACIGFIALQSCLAYGGNGYYKLRDPAWRRGEVVFEVAKHGLFGSPPAARFLRRHPLPGKLLTWATLAMECLFPLVLVAGYPACWVFLAWGLVFHLFNAYFMGLNNFFWIFTATYPAILYGVAQVQKFVSGSMP